MFTIKYRTYSLSRTQDAAEGAPHYYDENEQIHGPFELISKEQDESGYTLVHAHRETSAPGMTFGPIHADEAGKPRPTLWVMNEQGSTIAKYDL